MPYIDRDEAGHVIGLYESAQRDGQEFAEVAELWVAPPTPLAQIQALESQYANDQARMTRVSLLALALEKAQALGYTHEQLMSIDKGYKALYLLEQQVEALRAQL